MTPNEIKQLRIKKGYPSAYAAGPAYGVSRRTWQRWERGDHPIPQHAINWLKGKRG